jgi:hypothetical protein
MLGLVAETLSGSYYLRKTYTLKADPPAKLPA